MEERFKPFQALKSLALVRQSKIEESLALCDEVFATKPTDDAVLSAMTHVLRGLGRCAYGNAPVCVPLNDSKDNDVTTMFDEAFKRYPANEEFGVQTFFANIRAGNWKAAQQVRDTRVYLEFKLRRKSSGRDSYAQAISGRSLLVLECYECDPSGTRSVSSLLPNHHAL